jgi:hypothetical protein
MLQGQRVSGAARGARIMDNATEEKELVTDWMREEVFQVPQKYGVLGFKLAANPHMKVEGEFSVELAYTALSLWAITVILGGAFGDKPLQGTPVDQAGIKLHPKWDPNATGGDLFDLMYGFIRQAVKQGLGLMLTRVKAIPRQALTEAIIAVVLEMEENEIITIEGSRAEIVNARAAEAANIVLKEMEAKKIVKTRRWNSTMQRKALLLYEDTIQVLQELKRTYFGSQAKRIQRKNPNLPSWEDARAKHPQLAPILKRLPGHSPRPLALSYVGACLGSASESYTYRQIKIARQERRRRQTDHDQEPLTQIEVTISRVVDHVAKKWEH